MKLKHGIFLLGSLWVSSAFADMFCPNNFNSINKGDSLESVLSACGKPDSQKKSQEKPFQAQEWVYFVASSPDMPGTLKTTIAFDANGKVVNMSVNGSGLTETQICGGKTIQFGDTPDAIKAACGAPAYVTPMANGAEKPKDTEVVELHYNSNPPVTLTFRDGKLVERKEN